MTLVYKVCASLTGQVHHSHHGGLAQLARAPALQAGGHRFESDILHHLSQDNLKQGTFCPKNNGKDLLIMNSPLLLFNLLINLILFIYTHIYNVII